MKQHDISIAQDGPKNKAVIYARYSSAGQRDVSIEQQVEECRRYCDYQGLEVAGVYADRALSGTSDKRPQFQKLIRDSERGLWQVVVCYKVDRFARNRYDSANYKARLKKNGVTVAYAKEAIPDGPEGIILESVLEGYAEYYSANLSQNVKRGLAFNAANCLANSGAIPYGYRVSQDKRYEPDPAEAPIAREIFRRYAAGETIAGIARDLNRRQVPRKNGARWSRSSFERMLKNEMYIGIYHYGGVRVPGGVPAIIDKKLFAEVTERMENNRRHHCAVGENAEYMLSGKLYCGDCGERMTGMSGTGHGGTYYYYSCVGRKHGCGMKNVKRDELEDRVVEIVCRDVLQPEVIGWIADRAMEIQTNSEAVREAERMERKVAELEQTVENLMAALEVSPSSQAITQRLAQRERELADLRGAADLARKKARPIERDALVFWMSRFANGDLADPEFRRRLIQAFVRRVTLFSDRIKIDFNFLQQDGNYGSSEEEFGEVREGEPEASFRLRIRTTIIIVTVAGLAATARR